MKVVYCGQLKLWKNAPDHLGIQQGMTELGWDWHVVDPCVPTTHYSKHAGVINQIQPDLVIHGNTDSFGQRIFQSVDSHIKQIFCMLDYRTPQMLRPGEWDEWTQSAPYIDAVFVSAKDHIDMWKNAFSVPVYFAPHACWKPDKLFKDSKYEYDVLFVGGHHETGPLSERFRLIMEIKRLLQKEGITLTEVNETEVQRRNHIWTIMPQLYYSAKTVLDISHFWQNTGYCSGRYWYTATLGACAITKRFPECEDFFLDKKHKCYFDTPEQAVGIILDLLKNEDVRNVIKAQVMKHAWSEHSYAKRFNQMIKVMGMAV